ncbi:hypothetical protein HPB49_007681 [Dermacentor silvarum]|uniref:Uncharacterized protein n=1 Tax=Dermacentor silvarum TaxID=543639 RepID=A0ACB8DBL9_DERSI|nr:hypothetical protein HPB49_007681 [Dermacentor silvarum]
MEGHNYWTSSWVQKLFVKLVLLSERLLVSNPNRTSAERTVQQRSATKRASPTMERKILAIIDYDRLACLQCERLFSSLRRHAAVHLGYSRYQCTRCSDQS